MTRPTTLHHLTLNTGQVRQSPRSEVGQEAIEFLTPLVTDGKYALPRGPFGIGYSLQVLRRDDCALAEIQRRVHPLAQSDLPPKAVLVRFAVACRDNEAARWAWRELCRKYLEICDRPGFRSADFCAPSDVPPPAPWCAAFIEHATPDEALWIADLERCFAWTLIEQANQ